MEHQTTDQTLRDVIIDRLHELVNDGCYEDAIALYEEYKESFEGMPVI